MEPAARSPVDQLSSSESARDALSRDALSRDALSRDVLRIQAAAVAAQQTALVEDEIRLQQRLSALSQQEKQLSTHLEEKRRKLIHLQEKAQAERASLHSERSSYEQFVNRVLGDLTQAQRELVENQQRVQAERRRLAELHRKLRQRWQRHWQAEKQKITLRQEELANDECNLAKENERLQKGQEAFAKDRLRFNGEYELGRCHLRQAWSKLHEAQRQWRTRRRQERSALRLHRHDLAQAEAAVTEARRLAQQEQSQWAQARERLDKEVEGLNTRIRHQRDIVFQNQEEIARLEALLRDKRQQITEPSQGAAFETPKAVEAPSSAQPGNPEPTATADSRPEAAGLDQGSERETLNHDSGDLLSHRLTHLQRLAGDLADQRAQLVEQWEHLAGMQQRWEQDRGQAVAEFETAARNLSEQEQAQAGKEQQLREVEESVRKKHRELVHLRQHMVGWRARLRAREMAWEKERNQRLIQARQREELAKHHLKSLGEIRRRWAINRRLEVDKLRAERAACESLRKDYATLRLEWQRRCAALDQDKRVLAEKQLALEQFRHEVLSQSANAPAADRRVERLRRRWITHNAHAIRALTRDRETLKTELADLEARSAELQKRGEEVAAAETAFAEKKTTWEHKQTLLAAEQARLTQELKTARARYASSEQHVVRMKDEVERIARALLDEPQLPALPAEQAA